jgi:glucose/arabinose dehydrogenase
MKKVFSGIVLMSWSIMVMLGCQLQRGEESIAPPAYSVETIETPEGLSVETGGLDFLPDGHLITCYRRGEVMTYNSADSSWNVFAKGLQDPLGIRALGNHEVLVMQRAELTRLKDTDQDGHADWYKTVSDDFGMSGNYHEFAFGPEIDEEGNYYFALNVASNGAGVRDILRGKFNPLGRPGRMYSAVPYRGWVMKVTPEGETIPWASGLRSPNGLELDRKGNLFVTDNQGDWLGTSKLYHIQKGNFYGHPSSLVWLENFNINPLKLPVPALNLMRTKAAVEFPHGFFVNSPTQPLIDRTEGKFGPFSGQMFIGEMNHKRIVRVMLEKVQGEYQGATVSFIDSEGLNIGNNRLAFSPSGDLWVGQTDHGWSGNQGIQKISWNGIMPMEVHTMSLTETGFKLTFTKPIDPAAAEKTENYQFERYYYKYHREYGSDRYGVKQIKVQSVEVSEDRKSISLELEKLDPSYIYDLEINNLSSRQGDTLVHNRLFYTLNHLRK